MPTYTQLLIEAKIRRYNSPRATPTFRTLQEMLELGKQHKFICCIEEPFGIPDEDLKDVPRIKEINYGHVVGALNQADLNEWDAIFPGHTCALNLVVCDKILGYVHADDGNHKLIGRCYDAPDFSEEEFDRQLKLYVQKRRDVYDDGCHAKLFGEPMSHFNEY